MKKIFLLSILLLFALFTVFAADPQLLIVAYDGISGIPVGTNYYHAAEGGEYMDGTKSAATKDSKNFTNDEMIGLIQFHCVSNNSAVSISMKGKITVTVNCPNGFYLVSQSDPNYKRPFQILLRSSWGSSQLITEDNPTLTFDVDMSYIYELHFDVAISLPGTTENSTKECTVTKDGGKTVIYSLKDGTDYSAVVTFDVKYVPSDSSANTIKDSVTLPFSGYYDSTKDEPKPKTLEKNGGDGVSMSIILNSEAYNIDIKNRRGVWIPIGELYFNMMIGKHLYTDTKAAIFFSSSENPTDKSAEKFTMVHDEVGATTVLSSQNSIGFKLRVIDDENTSNITTFYGDTYFDTDNVSSSDYIYFYYDSDKDLSKLKTDYMSSYYTYSRSEDQVRSYFRYSGKIEIMLDNNGITMHQGRYTETIYVHVMVYK